jgi:hypothetical protein
MQALDAKQFVILLHGLFTIELQYRNLKGELPTHLIESSNSGCRDIINILRTLDLPHSIKVAENLLMDAKTAETAHQAIRELTNSAMLELEGRKFFRPLRTYESYYENPKLFGDQVFTNFPSANEDIAEAGTCLALERPTACVMHLMRVMEVGLAALGKAVNVSKQNDWGGYLREIDKALAASMKAAGARTAVGQFYAEAAAMIDNVRRAWRNPTMHADKSYSLERAEEILQSVKSFMRHLATKLSE